MFFIFTYVMSRVTHTEPGLPMVYCERVALIIAFKIVTLSSSVIRTVYKQSG